MSKVSPKLAFFWGGGGAAALINELPTNGITQIMIVA